MNPDNNFWAEYARRRENDWLGAISRLLQFNTVSGDASPEGDRRYREQIKLGFHYLDDLARGMGFVTRNYDNRAMVIEMPGPSGAPVLGFPIHLDVVPAGEGWTRDPFGGEIAEMTVWGRGAQDDKGPIIQVLYGLLGALEMARATDRTFRKTVRVIIVSEEELGIWDDIPFYFQREAPPDFSIVPDAHFPITNGEKGFVDVEVSMSWAPPLSGGASAGASAGSFAVSAGERSNVVPARANATVGLELLAGYDQAARVLDGGGAGARSAPRAPEFEMAGEGLRAVFHGVNAHGSTPEKGHNAARDALAWAAALPSLAAHPARAALDWLARAASSLDGEFLGIAHSHEKVGATTVNLGVLRVDGVSARATLNIRYPIGLTGEQVRARVAEAAAAFAAGRNGSLSVSVQTSGNTREPIYVDPEQFAAWIDPMRAAYEAVTHRPSGLQSIGGTTFAKAFPNAVCFGPVDPAEEPELAHQLDERVTIQAMRRNVEIYGRTIAGLAL